METIILIRNLHEEIKNLEKDIVIQERLVNQAIMYGKPDSVKKGLAKIDSDMKYLSIIANGAPIDPIEDKKIRKFLIKHFQNKRNLTVFASL